MFLKANLEGLGVVIKTIYNFVDYNLRVEISSKRRGFQKKRRKFWDLLCLGGRQMTNVGEGRVCLGGPEVRGN